MTIEELTIPEQSTLLYLETCAMDHGGRVDKIHMNEDDDVNIAKFTDTGILAFGRIKFHDIEASISKKTHYVHFTDKGHANCGHYRKVRAIRNWEKRTYRRAGTDD